MLYQLNILKDEINQNSVLLRKNILVDGFTTGGCFASTRLTGQEGQQICDGTVAPPCLLFPSSRSIPSSLEIIPLRKLPALSPFLPAKKILLGLNFHIFPSTSNSSKITVFPVKQNSYKVHSPSLPVPVKMTFPAMPAIYQRLFPSRQLPVSPVCVFPALSRHNRHKWRRSNNKPHTTIPGTPHSQTIHRSP